MGILKDISGQRFGRLVVVENDAGRDARGHLVALCQCDCGARVVLSRTSVQCGNTRSCGCLKRDALLAHARTHGKTETPEYIVWMGMRQRCQQRGRADAMYYHDKGVVVCQRWGSFENFLADMGSKPTDRHMLDRINNDGAYSPENCRWVTPKEQARNKTNNHLITFNGETRPLAEWAEIVSFPYDVIKARLRLGWPVERALTQTPKRKPGSGNFKRPTITEGDVA